MTIENNIKLFHLSTRLTESELDAAEKKLGIDLGRGPSIDDKDEEYYPQFNENVRRDAAAMSKHYELVFCLERSAREVIREKMIAEVGPDWWEKCVPQIVRENVEKNIARERDSGVTPRSEERLDYTTFGELGDIVRINWKNFEDIFNSEKAFSKTVTTLNNLRAPIAHSCPLAEDEVARLKLALKDWFRMME